VCAGRRQSRPGSAGGRASGMAGGGWLSIGRAGPWSCHRIVRLSTSLARLVAATSPSPDGRAVPVAGSPSSRHQQRNRDRGKARLVSRVSVTFRAGRAVTVPAPSIRSLTTRTRCISVTKRHKTGDHHRAFLATSRTQARQKSTTSIYNTPMQFQLNCLDVTVLKFKIR
jgi:hypothetical protein